MQEGWRAWLLAFGAAVCVLIEHGSLKAMGVMMLDIEEDFASKTWIIGSITALMTGTGSLFGMLTDVLCKQVHPRWVVVVCGCLTFVGYVVSSQASELALFSPFLIFFCGIGQEIAHLVTIGTLVEHFDNNYGMAITIANSGTSLSLLVVAPVTLYLKEIFHWRGAMLIISAISFNIVPCGLIMPPVISAMATPQQQSYISIKGDNATNRGGRILSAIHYIMSITHASLFRNIHFTGHIIGWFAANYSLVGWFIFIIPCAEKKGISPNKAVFLSTFSGVSSILVRFVGAILIDRKLLHVTTSQICSFAICGCLLIAIAFVDTFNVLAVITTVFGGASAFIWLTLYYQIKDIVGVDMIIPGLAWSSLAGAISGSLVGIVSGGLDERFGNLNVAFIVLGAPMLFAAMFIGLTARCPSRHTDTYKKGYQMVD